VLLGTAGGPLPSPVRSGIAQALVAGGGTYLLDCGTGVTRQLRRARLLASLRRVLVTHLHSDHTCDLFDVFLLGWPVLQWNPPVVVHGPGPAGGAGALPAAEPGRAGGLVAPHAPTPGLVEHLDACFAAHAYDLNLRVRDSGRRDLRDLVRPQELPVPPGAQGPAEVAPDIDPFAVFEDDHVRVSATLVHHAPVFPAYAFRLDTDDGSVVVSGDTAPCENLVRLARGADVLVHEVYDDTGLGPAAAEPPAGDDEDEPGDDPWEARRRHHHLVTSHTALGEVGRVAAAAGVGRLVLTHFVPGDDTIPDEHWVAGAGRDYDGEVVVGHDLLELPLRTPVAW